MTFFWDNFFCMMKAQYYVLAAALVTGTALGLVDIFRFDKNAEESAGEGTIAFFSQSAPRFERTQAKKDITQITPSHANLGVLIPLYANMSVEELRTEIKRLYEILKKERRDDDNIVFLIQYLVMKVGRDFPEDVRYFLDNGMIDSRSTYVMPLLQGWARTDFDAAMAYLLQNKDRWNFSGQIFSSMVRVQAEEAPEKTMEWMLSQTGKVRGKAIFQMINVLEEKHPAQMGDFVGRLLPSDLKNGGLFELVAKKWGACDCEKALLWADTLSDKQKNKAIAEILGGLGESQLEKATEIYKKQPQELQADIAAAIVGAMIQKSELLSYVESADLSGMKQALEWLMENSSDAKNTDKLARNIVSSSRLLTPEFVDYVQKMPEGAIKDNALRGMSNMTSRMVKYGQFTYEEAFALTEQIKDPAIQMESKENNVENWINEDPETARHWIQEKSGFSDEEKQKQFKACEASIQRLKENPKDDRTYSGQVSIIIREQ